MIELSDLIYFGYDLSDTQDRLWCWSNGVMGFMYCGKHPLLMTRIQGNNIGVMPHHPCSKLDL